MRHSYPAIQLRRLTQYLFYLKSLPADDAAMISSPMIAEALNMGEVQVRKDLAAAARPGNKKKARVRKELIADLEDYLGLNHSISAVYISDSEYDPWQFSIWGDRIAIRQRINLINESPASIRVPAQVAIINISEAQFPTVCDAITAAGIHVIWNIGPVPFHGHKGIQIHNEVLHSSLLMLSRNCRE